MKDELIGKDAEIILTNKRFRGKIINETKNTLVLKGDKIRNFLKGAITINIGGKEIKGKKISRRPEDRIKAC